MKHTTPIQDNALIFTVILKDFVESMMFKLRMQPHFVDELMSDISNNPDEWFAKWCNELGMGVNLVVFAVAAKSLLAEYAAEQLGQQHNPRLQADTDARQQKGGGK